MENNTKETYLKCETCEKLFKKQTTFKNNFKIVHEQKVELNYM